MKYRYMAIACLAMGLGISHYTGYTPLALSTFFITSSIIAYVLYARDKSAAVAGAWRVSEKTLHIVAVLFGWPGALMAQYRLRHKTKKKSFRAVFWCTVLINLAGVAWLHCPVGNKQLREGLYQLESLAILYVPYEAPVSAMLFLTKFRSQNIEWVD